MSASTQTDVFSEVVNDLMQELHPLPHSVNTILGLVTKNLDSPVLAHIQHLSLSKLNTNQMNSLLPALVKMTNLTSLSFPDWAASPAHLKFLFTECPALSKLQSLELSDVKDLAPQDLKLLSQSTTLTNLTALNFSNCPLTKPRIDVPPTDGFTSFGRFSARAAPPLFREEEDQGRDPSGLIALLSSSVVKNLTHLNLHGTSIGPSVHIALATSPFLTNLTSLDVSASYMTHQAAITALAASTTLANLTHLNLNRTYPGDAELATLFSPPSLLPKKLQSLDLGKTSITTVFPLQAVLKASPHLTELGLHGNYQLGAAGAEFVARHMPNLTKLDLSHCYIEDEGLQALATSTTLTNLRELDVSKTYAESKVLLALVNSPVMANLTHLALGRISSGLKVLAAIAQSPSLSQLQSLSFSSNRARDAGVSALAQSTTLTNLTWLDLSNCEIGSEGITALCTSPVASKLTCLRLDGNHDIGKCIAAVLAAPSSTLYSVVELGLAEVGILDTCMLQLLATPNLDQLNVLNVCHKQPSSTTQDRYRTRFDDLI